MATRTATNSFLQRLIGAAALDAAIYEEVEADPSAMSQALAVVVLSSLAAGIGTGGIGGTSIGNIGFISVAALIAWAAWALITFEIGKRECRQRNPAGFGRHPLHTFDRCPAADRRPDDGNLTSRARDWNRRTRVGGDRCDPEERRTSAVARPPHVVGDHAETDDVVRSRQ